MNKSRPETVNIIVIDDDLNNIELISLYLSGCGYSVKSFSKEIEALNYLQAADSKISLIILDLMLTEISGYELCRRIRSNSRYRFTPILISSGLTDNKDKNAAMEAGADDFINKPIDRHALITRTRSLIRIQTLYDELLEKN
ncbi:MAG TPA: response regulator, partial [Candidatus Wallbacteria bacterium]|nr:response regulator [Candidatus Wallbacteria bacterium]